MKKVVRSSHLSLRFYKRDGWTQETLEKYLERGRVRDQWEDQNVRDYFFLDHTLGSRLDVQRLYDNEVSHIIRWYDGDNRESDVEYLASMNWG